MSYEDNSPAAASTAIFSEAELNGFSRPDREAAETIYRTTGSKAFAIKLVRDTRLMREKLLTQPDSCLAVIKCAIDAHLTRDSYASGDQTVLDLISAIFPRADIAMWWQLAEESQARERFVAAADQALGDHFAGSLFDQRRNAEKADDPSHQAALSVATLARQADRDDLPDAAVKSALSEAFSRWCDLEAAWQKHTHGRENLRRQNAFCTSLAAFAGTRYDPHNPDHNGMAAVHQHIETLRNDPDNEQAIDGVESWIENWLSPKHAVKTIDFLMRKLGEFAAPDDRAYDNVRLSPTAERQTVLAQQVTALLGAHVAESLEQNHYDLEMYLSSNRDLPAVLWGDGKEILWATGEALLICSDIGCGKTTLAGLLARALLDGGDVLGHPVTALRDNPRILYLALDRPAQIGRSLARQITPAMSERYGDSFTFVAGPLPIDLSETPDVFPKVADYYGADVVIVDSLKDIAMGISEDRAMANYNRARQSLLASGRELVELHHLTKKGDLYGAKWLDAGVGSVLRITGKPGGAESTVSQYKPVAHLVPPIKVTHDRDAGEMLVNAEAPAPATAVGLDVAAWVAQHPEGVTKVELVAELGGDAGNHADRERAARQLNALAGADGPLRRVDGAGRANPTRWVVEPARESSRTPPDVGV